MKQILWVTLSLGLSLPAFAATYQCTKADWATPSKMDGKLYIGIVTATCQVKGASSNGIAGAKNVFLAEIAKDQRVSGPTQEQYEGMPSEAYGIIRDDGEIKVHADAHLATDGKSRLVFAQISTSIDATGQAKSTKNVDIINEVKANPNPGEYTVVLTTTIKVEKPWFAPGDIFKNQVDARVIPSFQQQLDQAIPTLANAL